MKEKEWKNWLKTQHSKKIMVSGPITSWQINGKKTETVTDFSFLGSKITVDGDCSHEIKRCLWLGRKAMTNPDNILKKQRHHFANESLYSQSYGVSSSHVWMWELDHKESWVPKNLNCGVGEDPWESLGLQGDPINQSHRKSVLIFTGRTDAQAEAPILWPPDVKSQLVGKDPDAGKDRGQ